MSDQPFCAVRDCARAGRRWHVCLACNNGKYTLDELRAHRAKYHDGTFDPHFDNATDVASGRRRDKRNYAAMGEMRREFFWCLGLRARHGAGCRCCSFLYCCASAALLHAIFYSL